MNKPVLLLSLVLLCAFASCKKTFDCECETTVTATNQGVTQTIKSNTETTVQAANKSKADGTCNTFKDDTNKKVLAEQTTGGVQGTQVSANTVCTLNERK